MRAPRRREQGKPAAALAIIASIFAIAFVIKLLPPATRQALLPVAHRDLPSRALLIWNAGPPSVSAALFGDRVLIAKSLPRRSAQREGGISVESTPVETTADLPLTFDGDPGEAPLLPSATLTLFALPIAAAAEPAEIETGSAPLLSAFTKTGSALRLAFVKTGNALRILEP